VSATDQPRSAATDRDLRGVAAVAEFRIGRLMIGMTYTSVVVLVIGVALMVAAGISPLSGGPAFDATQLLAELTSISPVGFLWLGLVIVIATPIVRVIGAAISFGLAGQWTMVAIAVAILVVIVAGVAIAATGTV
jgi:uncharacterized membrane protein